MLDEVVRKSPVHQITAVEPNAHVVGPRLPEDSGSLLVLGQCLDLST